MRNGKVIPPPHIVKQKVIEEYQNKFAVNVLVETGTFMGEMLYAQRKNFKSIYSIELSNELYKIAKQRLKNYKHINLLRGDSGDV
jgi:protein-L-isoaspartate O-methyltransferase